MTNDVARGPRKRSERGGATILFTGLSGSGKSSIARDVLCKLTSNFGCTTTLLDGDEVRSVLSKELGFSRADREMHLRRIGFVAALVAKHGGIALCACIAPYAEARREMRAMVEGHGRFIEVYVSTPLYQCEARDPKGLYAAARAGFLSNLTGVDAPYEVPVNPDVEIDASNRDIGECAELLIAYLSRNGIISRET